MELLLKQSCRLLNTYWECSSGKFMKFSGELSQKLLSNGSSCNWLSLENVLTKIYFSKSIWFFSFMFWYSIACIPRDQQKQPPAMFCKDVLRNFVKFLGKRMCLSLLFNKVTGLRSATFLKMRLWHRCFPANFAKFLRTSFFQKTFGRLLLG